MINKRYRRAAPKLVAVRPRGRPLKWVFTKAEREVVQGLWMNRRYKNDAERTLAIQQRTGKPIARAWLRRTFGSPHGR